VAELAAEPPSWLWPGDLLPSSLPDSRERFDLALKKSPPMIQNGIYLNVLGVISADSKPDLAAELAED
jgi:hypothetical protein